MKITRYWIPVFLGFSIIFYLSSLPQDQLPNIEFPYLDKLVHFFMYLTLGLLLARALTSKHRQAVSWNQFKSAIFASMIITITYGALDEWHQSYTPGRAVEFLDFVADILGACTGSFLVIPYRRWALSLEASNRHKNSPGHHP